MTNIREIIKDTSNKFSEVILKTQELYDNIWLLEVKPEKLPTVLDFLFNKKGGHLLTMAGTDARPIDGSFYVDYVLGFYPLHSVIIVRAKLNGKNPQYPSATPYVPSAGWYEREVMEMLGIKVLNHPDPRRLFLADNIPEGFYPLRKDSKYNEKLPISRSGPSIKIIDKKLTVIPYGPYHFALDEPIFFRFYVDGEKIIDADYRFGFAHRGIEKIAESKLNFEKIHFIAERVCGICGFVHSECYVQAIERVAKVDVPERARWIRTILLELERIHSHLLWLGVASHLVGFDSGFMQFWRVREKIMWLAEELTGNRKTYGMILIGGVRRNINERKKSKILEIIKEVKREYKELIGPASKLYSFLKRLRGVGYLSKEDAIKMCVTGPVARASGIKIDARKDFPYEAYREFDFEVPVYEDGDVLARTLVRAQEVFESLSIIEQAVDSIPDGPILTDVDWIPPFKLSIGIAEAPRGTDTHVLITGKNNTVYRWRVRAPTYANLQAVPLMLKGYTLADAPLIIGSIDPCISCTERVLIIDKSGNKRIMSQEDLLKFRR